MRTHQSTRGRVSFCDFLWGTICRIHQTVLRVLYIKFYPQVHLKQNHKCVQSVHHKNIYRWKLAEGWKVNSQLIKLRFICKTEICGIKDKVMWHTLMFKIHCLVEEM